MKRMGCRHHPTRYYSGSNYCPIHDRTEIWVACCDCGEVLHIGCDFTGEQE